QDVVKTLIYMADDSPVAVLVRGDEEINEAKLRSYLGCDSLELATDDIIYEVTNSPRGFAGPINIKSKIVADYSFINMANCVVGANKGNYHIKNANIGRDFEVTEFADLRLIKETDNCPRCESPIKIARGIEVGHVFKLGTKYSKAMKATYLDKDGKEKYMVMGCYGIGIGRTVAASIEQNYDDNGIIWPVSIAPFQVIITPVNVNNEELLKTAESLYQNLMDKGIEVILDDRDERAGVKFNDADLIGIPLRVTIGPKKLAEGKVEVKIRKSGEVEVLSLYEVEKFITGWVQGEISRQ
ncbi:MAG: proline--tRNA ligase, partial [Proteobacteria bacterium]|nr:proline--tRNA ligase [Pseudomonadota bacterium]